MEEKLSSIQKISDEIKAVARLKRVVQLDNERMGNLLHNISLYLDLGSLIMLGNEIFLQGLDCIDLIISLARCHVYFTKVATTHNF